MGLLDILSDFPGSNPNALYTGALNDDAFRRELGMRQLAAMAGAFGRAAMPTRMPVPLGAVLGTAGEAAGSAGDDVMKARLQAADAAQKQMYGEIYKKIPGLLANMQGLPGATGGEGSGSTGSDALPTMGGGTTGAGGMGTGRSGEFLAPAIDEMRKAGWSDAAIQAALGHGLAEGGFATNWNTGDRGASKGHWQFHAGGELPGYLKFAQANGLDPSDTRAQTRYMMQRMEQISPGFGKLTDPRAAMDIMGTRFERYAGNAPGQRGTYLAQAGTLLGSGGGGGATPPGSLSLPEVPSYGADLTRSRSLPTLAAPAAGGADDAQLRADYDASIARFQRGGKERAKPETFEQYKARMGGGESTGSSTDPMAGMTAADAGGGGDDGGGMGTGLNLGATNAPPTLPTLSPELRAPLPPAPAAAAAPSAAPSVPGAPTVPGSTFVPPQMQMPKVPGLSPQQQNLFNQLLIYSGMAPGLGGLAEAVKSNPAFIGAQEAAKRAAGLPFTQAEELFKKQVEIAGVGPIEAAKLPYALAQEYFKTNEQIRAAGPVAAAQNFERIRADGAAKGLIITMGPNGQIQVAVDPNAVKAVTEATVTAPKQAEADIARETTRQQQEGERTGQWRTVDVPGGGKVYVDANGRLITGPNGAPYQAQEDPASQAQRTKAGEISAQEAFDQRRTAEDAQFGLQSTARVRPLVDKMITGYGADARLEFGRILKAAGLAQGDDVVATQTYLINQLDQASRIAKRFGSGAGITERDVENAKQIAGGSAQLEKQTLLNILDMIDRTNRRALELQHQAYDRLTDNGKITVDRTLYKVPIPVFNREQMSNLPPGTPVIMPDGHQDVVPARR